MFCLKLMGISQRKTTIYSETVTSMIYENIKVSLAQVYFLQQIRKEYTVVVLWRGIPKKYRFWSPNLPVTSSESIATHPPLHPRPSQILDYSPDSGSADSSETDTTHEIQFNVLMKDLWDAAISGMGLTTSSVKFDINKKFTFSNDNRKIK